MTDIIQAWHWLADDGMLRDGRLAPPDGEWLIHDGPVRMCRSGLHYSENIVDALLYAPGFVVCRVSVRRIEDRHSDKGLCRERRINWRCWAQDIVLEWARECAADVLHLWDAPDVVVRFLKTGQDAAAAYAAAYAANVAAYAANADAAAYAANAAYADVATAKAQHAKRLEAKIIAAAKESDHD